MKIAVFGDVHYSEMAGQPGDVLEARDRFFAQVLQAFFDVEADYYVSLGDWTHAGSEAEFAFMRKAVQDRGLDRKFLHILGNHELKRLTKAEALAMTGQPRYHAIDAAEARLVFLDTSIEGASNGDIDDEQLAWFREEVRGAGAKPLIVFAHHPVYDTTPRSTEDGGRTTVRPTIDMRGILGRHRHVGLYVNGHIHINSIVRENNWSFVQTTSLLDAPGFRTIEVSDAGLKADFVHLEDPALNELRLFVAGRMERFRFNENVLGSPSDRTLLISKPS